MKEGKRPNSRKKIAGTATVSRLFFVSLPNINKRYMLFFLTSILSLTAIAADFIHFRRRRRRKQPVRRALVAWVAATDALPILSSLIGALSRDNGPELMYL